MCICGYRMGVAKACAPGVRRTCWAHSVRFYFLPSSPLTSPLGGKHALRVRVPWLACCALPVVQVAFVAHTLYVEAPTPDDFAPPLLQFGVLLAAVAGVVAAVKRVSTWLADVINRKSMAWGLVDAEPLKGAVRLCLFVCCLASTR